MMLYLLLIFSTLFSPPSVEKGGFKEGKYMLNLDNSSIQWVGNAAITDKFHTGSILPDDGYIVIQDEKLAAAHLSVDMTSINCEEEKLAGHLKSEDFFATESYPDAAFVLEHSVSAQDGINEVTGMVSIKGENGEETFDIELDHTKSTVTCVFEVTIDRTKYGIKYGSNSFFKALGDRAIADEFTIKGVLLFVKM